MHDLVIRGGTVVDGTGAAPRQADVAIDEDRIVAVGSEVGEGEREIDASGLLVTPGWVDIHTHYDGQVTWDPYLTPSGWNGVTTVVMGNCGVGFAPVRSGEQDFLIQLMEGVEDIPGSALAEGMSWNWESFPQYLDAIEQMPLAIDVGAQVPHGAVRAYVMGERGAKNEKATPEDIEAMARIVKEGLEAGGLGFTTSRTMVHRAKNGELVPGTHAEDDEIMGLGRMLGEVGHGVLEVASDFALEEAEFAWMRALGKETGRPIAFACLQNPVQPDQWKHWLEIVDEDAAEGGHLTPQVAQRPAGMLFSFQSSLHPFRLRPSFRRYVDMPRDEQRAALSDPAVRAAILADEPDLARLPGPLKMVASAWEVMYPLGTPPDYEPGPDQSLAAMSKCENRPAAEIAYDLMLAGEFIYLPFLGYSDGDLEPIREMMMHEKAVFGLSDGGAHCGLICDASMPTFLLTHWVRDRSRGERLPLERMVQAQTRRTAELYGLLDRGLLVPGMRADVNVIDFEALHLHSPEMVYDLPANGRRLIQHVDGYRYTVKNGQVIYQDGEPTGALPGALLRGPQASPNPLD